eukprot:TRINITY_DN3298_c0_g1_i1.p2 TRINITY_DN3298_c0_g1~~TRINITY_DN3298_c0_g1_i1.p2  ORF type:complete len:225 (-),score=22.94 TRINITY_DN3298_c0_g1_i1:838-1437(-)
MLKTLLLVSIFIVLGFVGAEEVGVPFCECVNADINCEDVATLDGLVGTLLDLSDVCVNTCSDECQAVFYPLHAYHELCPGFGVDAGELYHDLALQCQICDPGHIGTPIDRPECPPVDCSDFTDQSTLTTLLTSVECKTNCFTNNDCVDAWTRLSSYHETCIEEDLSNTLTQEYHDIEESCPPECAPPITPGPAPIACGP